MDVGLNPKIFNLIVFGFPDQIPHAKFRAPEESADPFSQPITAIAPVEPSGDSEGTQAGDNSDKDGFYRNWEQMTRRYGDAAQGHQASSETSEETTASDDTDDGATQGSDGIDGATGTSDGADAATGTGSQTGTTDGEQATTGDAADADADGSAGGDAGNATDSGGGDEAGSGSGDRGLLGSLFG